jgi:hypothetical protein
MQYQGRIEDHGEVLFDDLSIWIDEPIGEHPTQWRGQFTSSPHTPTERKGPFRLVLNDGRQGDVFLEYGTPDSDDYTIVRFIGCSPLT